jgi:dephospho-CoA kinase
MQASASPLRRIGLTGGIGSGKSTVAAMLTACGAVLIDSDAISRELTQAGGAAIEALRKAFGADCIDAQGALDRARMRTLAFADPGVRWRLEAVLHPLIGAETARRGAAAGDAVLVFDVPLLAESAHWRDRVQRVLVVDCSGATQIERVARRPGWDRAAAERVVAQQASRALRRSIADAVVFNDGIDFAALEAQVGALWRSWIGVG